MNIPIYIGTVALEKNRWGSRDPSFKVSEWAGRFANDGFDGIELWEFHYLLADDSEKENLANLEIPILYNSYVGFTDAEKEARDNAVKAINKLKAPALKYNLGHDSEKLEEYKKNLLAWSEAIHPDCRILSECHEGTVLDDLDIAIEFHRDLDPKRFGIIQHPAGNTEDFKKWYDAFPEQVDQLHMQFRTPESDPSTKECRESLEKLAEFLKDKQFDGKATIEFTRGIGKEENINEIYDNACSDMRCCREIFH
jgi:hypothetical protein